MRRDYVVLSCDYRDYQNCRTNETSAKFLVEFDQNRIKFDKSNLDHILNDHIVKIQNFICKININ